MAGEAGIRGVTQHVLLKALHRELPLYETLLKCGACYTSFVAYLDVMALSGD